MKTHIRTMMIIALLALTPLFGMVQIAAAQTSSDVVGALWTSGPVAENHPTIPDGIPYGEGRHMRALLHASVPDRLHGTSDLPVTYSLDLAKALSSAKPIPYPTDSKGGLQGFELDIESFVLVEVDPDNGYAPLSLDASGNPVNVPLTVFEGAFDSLKNFDPAKNPEVSLRWVMDGPTNEDRFFFLYFDTLHNGEKTRVVSSPQESGKVAASVGPGRGNRVFVPLHGDIGIQTAQDPRTVRITNLQSQPTTVDIFEYNRFGLPEEHPVADDLVIPAGLGSTVTYRLRGEYSQSALLIESDDGLFMVEAASQVVSSNDPPGMHRTFIPSADGGFVGTKFVETAAGSGLLWYAYCAPVNVPVGESGCEVRFNGAATSIKSNSFHVFQLAGGSPAVLDVDVGAVTVQRVQSFAGNHPQRALGFWPAMDGPAVSSVFMGHALSQNGNQVDRLLMMFPETGNSVNVRSMVGARSELADDLDVTHRGLFTDSSGGGWGTTWDRDWRLKKNFDARPAHVDGPVKISTLDQKSMQVVSGYAVDTNTQFSALVPLQSPDGGLNYEFVLPESLSGDRLGKLVMFAPFGGTDVVAVGTGMDGTGSPRFKFETDLRENEYIDDLVDHAGHWRIEANRPVLVAWLRVGDLGFSGFAPSITDAVDIQVDAVQFSGYLFGVEPEDAFKSARPGTNVKFRVDIQNMARSVTGDPVRDSIHLRAVPPPGWPSIHPNPSLLELGPGGSGSTEVVVAVPHDAAEKSGGATIQLIASSVGEKRLEVETGLRVNFKVQRGVFVMADGVAVESAKTVVEGEHVTYLVDVRNTGGVKDAFDLQVSLPLEDWTLEVQCLNGPHAGQPCLEDGTGSTHTLQVQESARYQFTVGLSQGSTKAFRLVTHILATSQSDPSVNGGVKLSTSLDTDRQFRIETADPTRVVHPADSTQFRLTVFNDADVDEELTIEVEEFLPAGWVSPTIQVRDLRTGRVDPLDHFRPEPDKNGVQGPPKVPVDARSSFELLVEQGVPPREEPLLLALDRIRFRSGLDPTLQGKDVELRVLVGEVKGFVVETPQGHLSVAPASSLTIPLKFISESNAPQELTVRPSVSGSGTGWGFNDSSGQESPWKWTVPAYGSLSRSITVFVPADAQPVSVGDVVIELRSSVVGLPVVPVRVHLEVAPEPVLTLGSYTMYLEPGRTNELRVPVTNSGNVPLDVHARWDNPPSTWQLSETTRPVAVGETVDLQFHATVPSGAEVPDEPLRLVLRDGGPSGSILEDGGFEPILEVPAMDVQLSGSKKLPSGAWLYEVTITNIGGAPLRDVAAVLTEETEVLDRVLIDGMLPGSTHVANLLSSSETSRGSIHVSAAHDPEGITIGTSGVDSSDTDPGKGASMVGTTFVVLSLLGLALIQGRSRS